MSQFDEKVSLFTEELTKIKESVDAELLHKVAKGLGPALYNNDAMFVAASNKEETDRVKKNFLQKKLGLEESAELDDAIKQVAEKMGKSNPRKHRALFYYLLVKHFGKEAIYDK